MSQHSPDPQALQMLICVSWLPDASHFPHFHYLFLLLRMSSVFALLHKCILCYIQPLLLSRIFFNFCSHHLPSLRMPLPLSIMVVISVSQKPSLLNGALKQLYSPGMTQRTIVWWIWLFFWGSHYCWEPVTFSQVCMLPLSVLKP